jgi:hypothetical protein
MNAKIEIKKERGEIKQMKKDTIIKKLNEKVKNQYVSGHLGKQLRKRHYTNVGVTVFDDPENSKQSIKRHYTNVGVALLGDPVKSNSAITLITLVITIVILILLASITINLALNDNGLFNKTKEAKAEVKEQIETAILTSQISGEDAGDIDTSILETELINTYGIEETDITKNGIGGNLPWSVKKDGYQYTITKAGEVKSTKTVTVEEIIANPKEYYGKEVANYAAGEHTYRIFYVDTETNESDNTKGYFGEAKNTVYLKADYVGTTKSLSILYNPDTKVKTMNPDWASNRESSESSWNDNEKAAAYLCSPVTSSTSTLPWASYYDSSKASYVIGGASVEMFIKSYNQTHDKNADGNEALSCEYQYTNVPGYVYKVYGETRNSGWFTNVNTVDYTNYNSMYCGKNESKGLYGNSYGYWLASPSTYDSNNVCSISCSNAHLNRYYYSDSYSSLAPLVSLIPGVEIEIYE